MLFILITGYFVNYEVGFLWFKKIVESNISFLAHAGKTTFSVFCEFPRSGWYRACQIIASLFCPPAQSVICGIWHSSRFREGTATDGEDSILSSPRTTEGLSQDWKEPGCRSNSGTLSQAGWKRDTDNNTRQMAGKMTRRQSAFLLIHLTILLPTKVTIHTRWTVVSKV